MPRAARADLQIGRFTIEFRNSNYNLKTGDIVLTGGVQGKGPDGDFRADRAFGNRERQEITLVGDVQAHRTAAAAPITLRSDTATIDERNKTYIATGNVGAIVGARTMSADEMRLDDGSHVFTLNGNVHISEPPGRTLATNELIYHDDSGDISAPGPVSGTTENGDFRADSAVGNVKAGLIDLNGGVVLHSGAVAGAPSREPVALYADKLHYDGSAKMVVASGEVKIEQGTQTVSAPLLTLNDATGDLHLSGGVQGAQPPDRTFNTKELTYNVDTGALTVPSPIRGSAREGDFAADRVNGNLKNRVYDLLGHAVVHSSGKRANGADRTPTTLSADRIHIDEVAKKYTAQGGVTVAQLTRTVSAPLMSFDDLGHIVKMTGGVHATEQPDRSADTAEVIWHSDSGAVLAPALVTGRSTTDSFRADRAAGNTKTNIFELQGGVVMRRQRPGEQDPTVLTAGLVRIDGNAHTYTATQNPKVAQGTRVMTGQVMSLDDTTHLVHVSGGVHAEQPQGRTFDTPEMTYNTQTDDFKMLGGIMAIFPLSRATPTPTPTPRPKSSLSPNAPSPFENPAMPAQYGSPTPTPQPTPTPEPTPSVAPGPTSAPSATPH
jgi:lipopolysaccharide assembly outer membrane protein LptD (OstA)